MENNRLEIYAPRYDGLRFDEHRLPLELIEDLSVLKEMTIEMAKHLYKQKNPDRERVPRNFSQGISFELEGLDEGSTIPKIVLICQMVGMFAKNPNIEYFEKARDQIISTIQAADDNEDLFSIAPVSILKYFSRIGKKLEKDEYIEFNPTGVKKAKYSRETRKRIVQASSSTQEYTDDVLLRGCISEMDFIKKTFTLDLINGHRLESRYSEELEEILKQAFISFNTDKRKKVLLDSNVRFSRNDSILKIEETNDISELEDKDVAFRLEELSYLRDGWFNGEGVGFNKSKLLELSDLFDSLYDYELELPSVFPNPNGKIQFEWTNSEFDISLEVNLDNEFSSQFHCLDFQSNLEEELEIELRNLSDWQSLLRKIEMFK